MASKKHKVDDGPGFIQTVLTSAATSPYLYGRAGSTLAQYAVHRSDKAVSAFREAGKQAAQRSKYAAENARLVRKTALDTGSKIVKNATEASNSGVKMAREALANVRRETLGARRAVGEFSRNLPVRRGRFEERILRKLGPLARPDNGMPFTAEQLANAEAGGRWKRPVDTARQYRYDTKIAPKLRRFDEAGQKIYDRLAQGKAAADQRVASARSTFRSAGEARRAAILNAQRNAASLVRNADTAASELLRETRVLNRRALSAASEGLTKPMARAGSFLKRAASWATSGDIGAAVGKFSPFKVPSTPGLLRKTAGLIPKAAALPFNMVEGFGTKIAAANRAGSVVRGLTSASGLAGGFALGAWMDAGVEFAKFMADDSVKLSDLGKKSSSYVTGEKGESHRVVTKNPGMWDIVGRNEGNFWGTFGQKLGNAAAGTVTFGMWEPIKTPFGESSDPAIAREEYLARIKNESDLMFSGRDPRTGKPLIDADSGEDISETVFRRNLKIHNENKYAENVAKYYASFNPANRSWAPTDSGGVANWYVKDLHDKNIDTPVKNIRVVDNTSTVTTAGLRAVLVGLDEDRRNRLARAEQYAGDREFIAGRLARRGVRAGSAGYEEAKRETVRKYLDGERTQIDKLYQKRFDDIMANESASKMLDENRAAYYSIITGGRDYAQDVNAVGRQGEIYTAFTKKWSEMSEHDRALFDVQSARAGYEKAVASRRASLAAEAAKAAEAANASEGSGEGEY